MQKHKTDSRQALRRKLCCFVVPANKLLVTMHNKLVPAMLAEQEKRRQELREEQGMQIAA